MKKNIQVLLVAFLALSISFTSCKKTDKTPETSSDLATHAADQAQVDSETDAVSDDANNTIDNFGAFNGRPGNVANFQLPCNADIALDSTATTRRLTINYHGVNCQGNHTRTGVVVLSMPLGTHWGDVGAVLTIDVQSLHITRLIDNKSITINGTSTVTNVLGGRLFELATLGHNIVHEISSDAITVTFDDNTQRIWHIAKRREFTYDNGLKISTHGNHTDGTITGIAEWGTNRFGNPFVTSITEPMVIRQDCGFRLVSGEVTHQRLAANVVVTFGLDATGNPTSCPAAGESYYLKIVWTGANGVVNTFIRPY